MTSNTKTLLTTGQNSGIAGLRVNEIQCKYWCNKEAKQPKIYSKFIPFRTV